jgi:alkylated DNA repair dioxygenase AlkB
MQTTMQEFIKEDGAYVYVIKGWYSDHQQLHDQLLKEEGWIQTNFKIWGKTIPVPRKLMFVGDAKEHTYSGGTHTVHPWIDSVKSVLDDIVEDDQVKKIFENEVPLYNACLLNHYRDGNDSISMHSDKEAKDYLRSVISLSLGGSRKFKMQKFQNGKIVPKSTRTILIEGGDLMVMGGKCQELFKHGIDKVKKDPESVPSRISLTFRHLK